MVEVLIKSSRRCIPPSLSCFLRCIFQGVAMWAIGRVEAPGNIGNGCRTPDTAFRFTDLWRSSWLRMAIHAVLNGKFHGASGFFFGVVETKWSSGVLRGTPVTPAVHTGSFICSGLRMTIDSLGFRHHRTRIHLLKAPRDAWGFPWRPTAIPGQTTGFGSSWIGVTVFTELGG